MGRECLGQALGLGSFISNMEETYTDTRDPGRLLPCPYDLKKKKNQICACRFPYHLIKYKKNNPDYLQNLAICPLSAYHPLAEIRHISSCDDKSCIEQDTVIQEPWTRDSD